MFFEMKLSCHPPVFYESEHKTDREVRKPPLKSILRRITHELLSERQIWRLPRYSQAPEPWRNENRDEMLRMTLRVDGKPDYTLVLPADEEYLDAVKAYLDIDVFADALLCDIRFKVPYIGELIRDTDCPAVEDYNDFAEALEDIWQQDGALLTYAAVLEAERPDISFLTTTTTVDTLRFSKPIRKVTKNTKSGVEKSKTMCYNYYICLYPDEKRWTKYQFCKGITPVSMNFTERSGGK